MRTACCGLFTAVGLLIEGLDSAVQTSVGLNTGWNKKAEEFLGIVRPLAAMAKLSSSRKGPYLGVVGQIQECTVVACIPHSCENLPFEM